MQNYSDSRTVFIKNLLRYYLYKTHFYRQDGSEKNAEDAENKLGADDDADDNDEKRMFDAAGLDKNMNEPPVLSKADEEIITELTYKM